MDERKWTKLKISLKKSIGENNFNNWLSPVEFSHVNEDVAVFSVPTNFLGNYVSQNFGEIIVAQISSENDKINRIRFEVDSDLSNFEGSQPSTPSPSNVPKDKIVIIKNADPGFDWIFGHKIKGLITQFGGANSHMTIRCAEQGLPAAIGCGSQTFKIIKKSKKIELNCKLKTIKVIN